MEEDAPAWHAGPEVVVEITPRGYRRRGVVCVVGGLLLTVVSVWSESPVWFESSEGRSFGNPFFGVALVVYGVWCAVQARRQVTRTLLRIGRDGIRSDDGRYDHTWSGVVMVWVGSSTGLRVPPFADPVLSVFTDAGIDFARRAGTRPKARYTVPVGLPWSVRRLCDELRPLVDATVVDGTRTSRAAAAAALEGFGGD